MSVQVGAGIENIASPGNVTNQVGAAFGPDAVQSCTLQRKF